MEELSVRKANELNNDIISKNQKLKNIIPKKINIL